MFAQEAFCGANTQGPQLSTSNVKKHQDPGASGCSFFPQPSVSQFSNLAHLTAPQTWAMGVF